MHLRQMTALAVGILCFVGIASAQEAATPAADDRDFFFDPRIRDYNLDGFDDGSPMEPVNHPNPIMIQEERRSYGGGGSNVFRSMVGGLAESISGGSADQTGVERALGVVGGVVGGIAAAADPRSNSENTQGVVAQVVNGTVNGVMDAIAAAPEVASEGVEAARGIVQPVVDIALIATGNGPEQRSRGGSQGDTNAQVAQAIGAGVGGIFRAAAAGAPPTEQRTLTQLGNVFQALGAIFGG